MKVTDEMVVRAVYAYIAENGQAHNRTALRDALTAALADVPELSDFDRGCLESMKHNAQRMREECRRQRARAEAAEARIAELEAKLEKVRELVRTGSADEPCARLLLAILEGGDE